MTMRSLLISSISLLLLAGCPAPDNDLPLAVDDEQPPAAAPVEVDVTLASWEEVENAIAGHEGKVVVVDLWSTSCAPCKREFPHLVELQNKHDAEKVACIGVSLDYYGDPTEPPESFRPAVEAFLTEQEATFQNFICTDSSDDVYTKVESFGVPIVMVYGPDGKLAKLFEDDGTYGEEGFTYEKHIGPLVKELIGDGA